MADALTWMEQALSEFGIAGLSLRSLIEFLKAALKNSNAAVRTSATKTLVTVKLFAGSCPSFFSTLRRDHLTALCSDQGPSRGPESPTARDNLE